jgi:carbonic anhydrase
MADPTAIPSRQLVVLTCMDVRIQPQRALGLGDREAHVLRNAGAVATDDVLRSLVLSQRLLGTRSVVVMAHTDCGVNGLDDEELVGQLATETGREPPFSFGGFDDLDGHVRQQVQRVRDCPWIPHRDDVRGCVLDVGDGTTRFVD